MQLNKSTYETIFLLYIDNELSSKEKLEVEAFIANNPIYALEMEALKATVLSAENMPYAFKENLKQQEVETSLETLKEDLEEDWEKDLKATYATILKEDMQAIPGLSTSYKKTLKKETVSEGNQIKPFGFNQHKFTYAAIAACLMVFVGYQQLTKSQLPDSPVSDSSSTNSIVSNSLATNSNQLANHIEPVSTTKQKATTKSQVSIASNTQRIKQIQQASIAMAEPTPDYGGLINQAMMKEIPKTYNNPIKINAIVNNSMETETVSEENGPTSYEVIDTEDPNRTIFIANLEIDGNKLRGLKRKVTSLFKNNKSERNQ